MHLESGLCNQIQHRHRQEAHRSDSPGDWCGRQDIESTQESWLGGDIKKRDVALEAVYVVVVDIQAKESSTVCAFNEDMELVGEMEMLQSCGESLRHGVVVLNDTEANKHGADGE